jgi:hypothetical protein
MFSILYHRLIAIILIIPILSSTVLARTPGDWKKVKKLAESKVVLITKAGERIEGKFINATDNSLYVKVQDESKKLNKDDIAEVRKKGKSQGKAIAFAIGIGAAGFLAGNLIGRTGNDESGLGPFAPIVGGAIGAGTGAVAGAFLGNKIEKKEKEELIYIAP